jgi:hypothetical protein
VSPPVPIAARGLLLLVAILLPAAAVARDEAPQTRAFAYSLYEEATAAAVLADLGLARARAPEGRTVEAVDVVRLEVIEERDPAPRLLNAFHVVTRERVARSEVLLRPGDPYRQTLADESRRILATRPQLSLVLVEAAEGAAGGVRVIVITKDVWSLRLNWDAAVTSDGIEWLTLRPSETNFLGTHQTLGLIFDLLPESRAVGVQYAAPRLLGGHAALAANAGVILRAEGGQEGSFGGLRVSSPLRTARQRWAWSAGGSWVDEVTRRYTGGEVALFALRGATCGGTPDACLPWAWRSEVAEASASITRSSGWEVKRDLTVGFGASTSRYTVPDAERYDPVTVAAFEQLRLPVGEDRVGPSIELRTYTSDFLRVLDLETLGLQEDHRLGPQAALRFYPVLRALGSSRDLFGLVAGGSYTAALGDGLARAGIDAAQEIEPDGDVPDASIQGDLRLVSPRGRFGRLVVDGVVLDRYRNSLNRVSALGGDTRLRGYPTQYLVGASVVAANLELRSRPVQLFGSIQLAGVAFYDLGDAFDDWSRLDPLQSTGLGARFLIPQLDRVVVRADVGFPLERPLPAGVSSASFFVAFGQAFLP